MKLLRSRTLLVVALAVGLVLAPASPAAAAPPSNDDFDAAIHITAVPFHVTADTTEATTAADDPPCSGDHNVWYALILDTTTDLVLDTVGSDFTPVVSAFTGTRGNLTEVACDILGDQRTLRFTVEAGVTYYIVAGSLFSDPGGHLVLNGQALPPPMQVAITLDPTGSVTSAGAAVIHGTVTCSRQGTVSVFGTLREQIGRKAAVGSYRISVDCSGPTRWQATVLGGTAVFRRGAATAVAVVQFLDFARGEIVQARADGTVQLR
jgi:hypothetical protein